MSALPLTRRLQFVRDDTQQAEQDGIPCTIATTTAVERGGEFEVLDCTPEGVDLSAAPLPLITVHDQQQLAIGVVENLVAHGDKVTGVARFGASPEAQLIRADVMGGIHRNLSVGYVHIGVSPHQPAEGATAYRWRPLEVSIVPVPADPAAGFYRSHESQRMTTAQITSNTTTVAKSTNPAAMDILQLCTRHGMADKAFSLIETGATMDRAKEIIMDELSRRDRATPTHARSGDVSRHDATQAEQRRVIENTSVRRIGGKVEGQSLGHATLIDLAVRSLNLAGARVMPEESRDGIYRRAFGAQSTSDFPMILGSATNRVLLQAFEESASPLKGIARQANRTDFRLKNAIRMDSAPELLPVNEHGEYKSGSMQEAQNGWRLRTYGRILALTRQAIINDDLDAFSNASRGFGAAAARVEAEALAQALINPAPVDGTALFDTTKHTLITQALDADGLAAAVLALRSQRDMGGGHISQEPGALIVPAALEMKARQLVATIAATRSGDVQPYQGLTVLVEPRLDAASASSWYLAAKNQQALEYGYLDGEQGLHTEERWGFEVDGLEVKARLDFGCGWTMPIGWVKSTGAS